MAYKGIEKEVLISRDDTSCSGQGGVPSGDFWLVSDLKTMQVDIDLRSN